MDAAGATSWDEFASRSILRMDQQEESIANAGRAIQALVAQVSGLTQQLQHLRNPAAPPPPPVLPVPPELPHQREPRLPTPEGYSGEPEYCRAFLTRCSMYFSLQPQMFCQEQTKVAFVLTLLSGKAALWGTAVWGNQDPCCASFLALSEEMKRVFDRAVAGREAARLLADLHQGERSVSEYSIKFRTLAAECHWNEEAQWDRFLHGLADHVQKEIYMLDLPPKLNGLIELAQRVDARLSRMGRFQQSHQFHGVEDPRTGRGDTVSPVFDLEPMQEKAVNLSNVPQQYQDLREVFSKSRTASLPPHCPYDCAIDLVPGKSPPKGKLY
uniref:Retrotransposon gag domain-containing protein n=1 Tax=Cyprinus carpio carpio TaxID=630221 RepID=A0A9J8CTZ9_CYPCA